MLRVRPEFFESRKGKAGGPMILPGDGVAHPRQRPPRFREQRIYGSGNAGEAVNDRLSLQAVVTKASPHLASALRVLGGFPVRIPMRRHVAPQRGDWCARTPGHRGQVRRLPGTPQSAAAGGGGCAIHSGSFPVCRRRRDRGPRCDGAEEEEPSPGRQSVSRLKAGFGAGEVQPCMRPNETHSSTGIRMSMGVPWSL